MTKKRVGQCGQLSKVSALVGEFNWEAEGLTDFCGGVRSDRQMDENARGSRLTPPVSDPPHIQIGDISIPLDLGSTQKGIFLDPKPG